MVADPKKKVVHLVCNAHLDPVWQWEWEEGAAEAISTFRVAADICEANGTFIFNHNEAILYRWIEEYEPDLFKRIQKLVRQKKWHIMGGWHLQPDCNMPSGESFVRQILIGKNYFLDKFGVEPTTAINFDSFGHSRGIPQILAKSGYDSYLFCRPSPEWIELPDEFSWVGCDGSEVMACRVSTGMYLSHLGKAREKVEGYLGRNVDKDLDVILWGVGNHGGGPSRKDVKMLAGLIEEKKGEVDIRHSTPEAFFGSLKKKWDKLPKVKRDLNPFAVGCYTSQIRLKQAHRTIENELYATEKMCAAAAAQGLVKYPNEELKDAERDLATGEFHDILPGSSIQPVEDMALRVFLHGQEIISRVKARAFFALASGQKKAKEGEIPILVYNPHPYPVDAVVQCEFMLADQNHRGTFTQVEVFKGKKALPTQVEKEHSNLVGLDWRKRVAFRATLEPGRMNRFDCKLEEIKEKPAPKLKVKNNAIRFKSKEMEVVINTRTGFIDSYKVGGKQILGKGACKPVVMHDDADAWGMRTRKFRKGRGAFKLVSAKEAAHICGVAEKGIAPVRIIEDGAVRTVVEAIFAYGDSFVIQHYLLPKQGTEFETEVRVHWNEKDTMLKWSLPFADRDAAYFGQVAYGAEELPANGDEVVAQKWVAAVSSKKKLAMTVINDSVYGSDCKNGEVRMTLLRSPAFCGHPLGRPLIVMQDRYTPRIDQGERLFRFWINGGPKSSRMTKVDREALSRNEIPMALSFFPAGDGKAPKAAATLSDPSVQIAALKQAEKGTDVIVRLFESSGKKRKTVLALPFLGVKWTLEMNPFEIRTLRINPKTKKVTEVDLLERPVKK